MNRKNDYGKMLIIIGLLFVIVLLMQIAMAPNRIKLDVLPNVDKSETMSIKVLVDGEIKEMGFEEYIVHVVAGEMYADYHIEALKAQAVTARTYTYKKLQSGGCGNGGAQMCDDIKHCQAYANNIPQEALTKIENAVYSTKGQIITYEGEPIIALFHSTSGGYTEDNVNVFGQNLPYLKSVISEGEENSSRFSRREVVSIADIKKKTKTSGESISVEERLPSGRVKTVNVFGKEMTGKALREALGLSSANFDIHIEGDHVVFNTIGYGHGVGLSQVGANAMANKGEDYQKIIKHYYTGVEISKIE